MCFSVRARRDEACARGPFPLRQRTGSQISHFPPRQPIAPAAPRLERACHHRAGPEPPGALWDIWLLQSIDKLSLQMDGAADLYASLRLQRTLFAFYFFFLGWGSRTCYPSAYLFNGPELFWRSRMAARAINLNEDVLLFPNLPFRSGGSRRLSLYYITRVRLLIRKEFH